MKKLWREKQMTFPCTVQCFFFFSHFSKRIECELRHHVSHSQNQCHCNGPRNGSAVSDTTASAITIIGIVQRTTVTAATQPTTPTTTATQITIENATTTTTIINNDATTTAA
jgi:hypothetical protein